MKRKVGPGGGDFALNPNRFGGGVSGSSKKSTGTSTKKKNIDKNLLGNMFGLSIKKTTTTKREKPSKKAQIVAIKTELKKKKPSSPPEILRAKLKILEGK